MPGAGRTGPGSGDQIQNGLNGVGNTAVGGTQSTGSITTSSTSNMGGPGAVASTNIVSDSNDLDSDSDEDIADSQQQQQPGFLMSLLEHAVLCLKSGPENGRFLGTQQDHMSAATLRDLKNYFVKKHYSHYYSSSSTRSSGSTVTSTSDTSTVKLPKPEDLESGRKTRVGKLIMGDGWKSSWEQDREREGSLNLTSKTTSIYTSKSNFQGLLNHPLLDVKAALSQLQIQNGPAWTMANTDSVKCEYHPLPCVLWKVAALPGKECEAIAMEILENHLGNENISLRTFLCRDLLIRRTNTTLINLVVCAGHAKLVRYLLDNNLVTPNAVRRFSRLTATNAYAPAIYQNRLVEERVEKEKAKRQQEEMQDIARKKVERNNGGPGGGGPGDTVNNRPGGGPGVGVIPQMMAGRPGYMAPNMMFGLNRDLPGTNRREETNMGLGSNNNSSDNIINKPAGPSSSGPGFGAKDSVLSNGTNIQSIVNNLTPEEEREKREELLKTTYIPVFSDYLMKKLEEKLLDSSEESEDENDGILENEYFTHYAYENRDRDWIVEKEYYGNNFKSLSEVGVRLSQQDDGVALLTSLGRRGSPVVPNWGNNTALPSTLGVTTTTANNSVSGKSNTNKLLNKTSQTPSYLGPTHSKNAVTLRIESELPDTNKTFSFDFVLNPGWNGAFDSHEHWHKTRDTPGFLYKGELYKKTVGCTQPNCTMISCMKYVRVINGDFTGPVVMNFPGAAGGYGNPNLFGYNYGGNNQNGNQNGNQNVINKVKLPAWADEKQSPGSFNQLGIDYSSLKKMVMEKVKEFSWVGSRYAAMLKMEVLQFEITSGVDEFNGRIETDIFECIPVSSANSDLNNSGKKDILGRNILGPQGFSPVSRVDNIVSGNKVLQSSPNYLKSLSKEQTQSENTNTSTNTSTQSTNGIYLDGKNRQIRMIFGSSAFYGPNDGFADNLQEAPIAVRFDNNNANYGPNNVMHCTPVTPSTGVTPTPTSTKSTQQQQQSSYHPTSSKLPSKECQQTPTPVVTLRLKLSPKTFRFPHRTRKNVTLFSTQGLEDIRRNGFDSFFNYVCPEEFPDLEMSSTSDSNMMSNNGGTSGGYGLNGGGLNSAAVSAMLNSTSPQCILASLEFIQAIASSIKTGEEALAFLPALLRNDRGAEAALGVWKRRGEFELCWEKERKEWLEKNSSNVVQQQTKKSEVTVESSSTVVPQVSTSSAGNIDTPGTIPNNPQSNGKTAKHSPTSTNIGSPPTKLSAVTKPNGKINNNNSNNNNRKKISSSPNNINSTTASHNNQIATESSNNSTSHLKLHRLFKHSPSFLKALFRTTDEFSGCNILQCCLYNPETKTAGSYGYETAAFAVNLVSFKARETMAMEILEIMASASSPERNTINSSLSELDCSRLLNTSNSKSHANCVMMACQHESERVILAILKHPLFKAEQCVNQLQSSSGYGGGSFLQIMRRMYQQQCQGCTFGFYRSGCYLGLEHRGPNDYNLYGYGFGYGGTTSNSVVDPTKPILLTPNLHRLTTEQFSFGGEKILEQVLKHVNTRSIFGSTEPGAADIYGVGAWLGCMTQCGHVSDRNVKLLKKRMRVGKLSMLAEIPRRYGGNPGSVSKSDNDINNFLNGSQGPGGGGNNMFGGPNRSQINNVKNRFGIGNLGGKTSATSGATSASYQRAQSQLGLINSVNNSTLESELDPNLSPLERRRERERIALAKEVEEGIERLELELDLEMPSEQTLFDSEISSSSTAQPPIKSNTNNSEVSPKKNIIDDSNNIFPHNKPGFICFTLSIARLRQRVSDALSEKHERFVPNGRLELRLKDSSSSSDSSNSNKILEDGKRLVIRGKDPDVFRKEQKEKKNEMKNREINELMAKTPSPLLNDPYDDCTLGGGMDTMTTMDTITGLEQLNLNSPTNINTLNTIGSSPNSTNCNNNSFQSQSITNCNTDYPEGPSESQSDLIHTHFCSASGDLLFDLNPEKTSVDHILPWALPFNIEIRILDKIYVNARGESVLDLAPEKLARCLLVSESRRYQDSEALVLSSAVGNSSGNSTTSNSKGNTNPSGKKVLKSQPESDSSELLMKTSSVTVTRNSSTSSNTGTGPNATTVTTSSIQLKKTRSSSSGTTTKFNDINNTDSHGSSTTAGGNHNDDSNSDDSDYYNNCVRFTDEFHLPGFIPDGHTVENPEHIRIQLAWLEIFSQRTKEQEEWLLIPSVRTLNLGCFDILAREDLSSEVLNRKVYGGRLSSINNRGDGVLMTETRFSGGPNSNDSKVGGGPGSSRLIDWYYNNNPETVLTAALKAMGVPKGENTGSSFGAEVCHLLLSHPRLTKETLNCKVPADLFNDFAAEDRIWEEHLNCYRSVSNSKLPTPETRNRFMNCCYGLLNLNNSGIDSEFLPPPAMHPLQFLLDQAAYQKSYSNGSGKYSDLSSTVNSPASDPQGFSKALEKVALMILQHKHFDPVAARLSEPIFGAPFPGRQTYAMRAALLGYTTLVTHFLNLASGALIASQSDWKGVANTPSYYYPTAKDPINKLNLCFTCPETGRNLVSCMLCARPMPHSASVNISQLFSIKKMSANQKRRLYNGVERDLLGEGMKHIEMEKRRELEEVLDEYAEIVVRNEEEEGGEIYGSDSVKNENQIQKGQLGGSSVLTGGPVLITAQGPTVRQDYGLNGTLTSSGSKSGKISTSGPSSTNNNSSTSNYPRLIVEDYYGTGLPHCIPKWSNLPSTLANRINSFGQPVPLGQQNLACSTGNLQDFLLAMQGQHTCDKPGSGPISHCELVPEEFDIREEDKDSLLQTGGPANTLGRPRDGVDNFTSQSLLPPINNTIYTDPDRKKNFSFQDLSTKKKNWFFSPSTVSNRLSLTELTDNSRYFGGPDHSLFWKYAPSTIANRVPYPLLFGCGAALDSPPPQIISGTTNPLYHNPEILVTQNPGFGWYISHPSVLANRVIYSSSSLGKNVPLNSRPEIVLPKLGRARTDFWKWISWRKMAVRLNCEQYLKSLRLKQPNSGLFGDNNSVVVFAENGGNSYRNKKTKFNSSSSSSSTITGSGTTFTQQPLSRINFRPKLPAGMTTPLLEAAKIVSNKSLYTVVYLLQHGEVEPQTLKVLVDRENNSINSGSGSNMVNSSITYREIEDLITRLTKQVRSGGLSPGGSNLSLSNSPVIPFTQGFKGAKGNYSNTGSSLSSPQGGYSPSSNMGQGINLSKHATAFLEQYLESMTCTKKRMVISNLLQSSGSQKEGQKSLDSEKTPRTNSPNTVSGNKSSSSSSSKSDVTRTPGGDDRNSSKLSSNLNQLQGNINTIKSNSNINAASQGFLDFIGVAKHAYLSHHNCASEKEFNDWEYELKSSLDNSITAYKKAYAARKIQNSFRPYARKLIKRKIDEKLNSWCGIRYPSVLSGVLAVPQGCQNGKYFNPDRKVSEIEWNDDPSNECYLAAVERGKRNWSPGFVWRNELWVMKKRCNQATCMRPHCVTYVKDLDGSDGPTAGEGNGNNTNGGGGGGGGATGSGGVNGTGTGGINGNSKSAKNKKKFKGQITPYNSGMTNGVYTGSGVPYGYTSSGMPLYWDSGSNNGGRYGPRMKDPQDRLNIRIEAGFLTGESVFLRCELTREELEADIFDPLLCNDVAAGSSSESNPDTTNFKDNTLLGRTKTPDHLRPIINPEELDCFSIPVAIIRRKVAEKLSKERGHFVPPGLLSLACMVGEEYMNKEASRLEDESTVKVVFRNSSSSKDKSGNTNPFNKDGINSGADLFLTNSLNLNDPSINSNNVENNPLVSASGKANIPGLGKVMLRRGSSANYDEKSYSGSGALTGEFPGFVRITDTNDVVIFLSGDPRSPVTQGNNNTGNINDDINIDSPRGDEDLPELLLHAGLDHKVFKGKYSNTTFLHEMEFVSALQSYNYNEFSAETWREIVYQASSDMAYKLLPAMIGKKELEKAALDLINREDFLLDNSSNNDPCASSNIIGSAGGQGPGPAQTNSSRSSSRDSHHSIPNIQPDDPNIDRTSLQYLLQNQTPPPNPVSVLNRISFAFDTSGTGKRNLFGLTQSPKVALAILKHPNFLPKTLNTLDTQGYTCLVENRLLRTGYPPYAVTYANMGWLRGGGGGGAGYGYNNPYGGGGGYGSSNPNGKNNPDPDPDLEEELFKTGWVDEKSLVLSTLRSLSTRVMGELRARNAGRFKNGWREGERRDKYGDP